MTEMNRRQFVAVTAASACCCLLGNALAAPSAPAPAGPVDAGAVSDFANEGIFDKFVGTNRFFLVRKNGKLYAVSASCTHERKKLSTDNQQIICREHKAAFSLEGKVVKGPPKRSLPRLGIKIDDKNHVIVDLGQKFDEQQWNNAAASVAVK